MLHMYKKYALHLYKYVHNVQNIWHTHNKRLGMGLLMRVDKRALIHRFLILAWVMAGPKTPTTANLHQ